MAAIDNVEGQVMPRASTRRSAPFRRMFTLSPAIWTVIVLLVGWEVGVRVTQMPEFILPAPSRIIEEVASYWPRLLVASSYTVSEILIGFGFSVLIGVPLAVLITYSRFAERAVY